MNRFAELQNLLEAQFGPFVRKPGYQYAFEDAMHILSSLKNTQTPSNIDTFYLFLHIMILKSFERIEELEGKLRKISST